MPDIVVNRKTGEIEIEGDCGAQWEGSCSEIKVTKDKIVLECDTELVEECEDMRKERAREINERAEVSSSGPMDIIPSKYKYFINYIDPEDEEGIRERYWYFIYLPTAEEFRDDLAEFWGDDPKTIKIQKVKHNHGNPRHNPGLPDLTKAAQKYAEIEGLGPCSITAYYVAEELEYDIVIGEHDVYGPHFWNIDNYDQHYDFTEYPTGKIPLKDSSKYHGEDIIYYKKKDELKTEVCPGIHSKAELDRCFQESYDLFVRLIKTENPRSSSGITTEKELQKHISLSLKEYVISMQEQVAEIEGQPLTAERLKAALDEDSHEIVDLSLAFKLLNKYGANDAGNPGSNPGPACPPGQEETDGFCAQRLEDPAHFDKRSFRTMCPKCPGGECDRCAELGIELDDTTHLVIGCPKGEYDPKSDVCKTSTRGQTILRPK